MDLTFTLNLSPHTALGLFMAAAILPALLALAVSLTRKDRPQ
jgi:hypothetical protein